MPVAEQRAQGRFVGRYDRLALYDVVREVARVADPVSPEQVRQRRWDAARGDSAYPDAPSAREVCRQLADENGHPYPWRQLLEDVLDRSRADERIDTARRGATRDDELTDEHLFHALNRIAGGVYGQKLITREQYVDGRAELIRRDRRRRDGGRLEAILPTIYQVETYAGGFERALLIAGLELPRKLPFGRAAGVPIVEAGVRFYLETDRHLPTEVQLRRFARQFDFALQDKDSTRRWREYVAEISAEIDRRGLPASRPYRPRHDRPVWAPPQQNPWADAQRYQPKTHFPTLASAVVPMAAFLALCRAEKRSPNLRYYGQVKKEHPDWPSHEALQKFGGFAAVKALARKPAELERARRELNPSAEERERRERAELERRLEHPTPQAILAALAAAGAPLSARQLAAQVGLEKGSMGNWLPLLLKAGRIERTTPSAVAKNVSYCLPGMRPAPDQQALAKLEAQIRGPNCRQVYELIAAGVTTTREISERMGKHPNSVVVWIRPFKQLGLVEQVTERVDGRKRTWYRATEESPAEPGEDG